MASQGRPSNHESGLGQQSPSNEHRVSHINVPLGRGHVEPLAGPALPPTLGLTPRSLRGSWSQSGDSAAGPLDGADVDMSASPPSGFLGFEDEQEDAPQSASHPSRTLPADIALHDTPGRQASAQYTRRERRRRWHPDSPTRQEQVAVDDVTDSSSSDEEEEAPVKPRTLLQALRATLEEAFEGEGKGEDGEDETVELDDWELMLPDDEDVLETLLSQLSLPDEDDDEMPSEDDDDDDDETANSAIPQTLNNGSLTGMRPGSPSLSQRQRPPTPPSPEDQGGPSRPSTPDEPDGVIDENSPDPFMREPRDYMPARDWSDVHDSVPVYIAYLTSVWLHVQAHLPFRFASVLLLAFSLVINFGRVTPMDPPMVVSLQSALGHRAWRSPLVSASGVSRLMVQTRRSRRRSGYAKDGSSLLQSAA